MDILRIALCVLSAALVAGCAAPQRPSLPDSGYDNVAVGVIGIQKCVENGQMTPETGAAGMTHERYVMSTWSFDQARMEESFKRLEGQQQGPDQAWCNKKSMMIVQAQQAAATRNQNVAAQQKELADMFKSTSPKQTYCNQVGTQTFCTTN